MSPFLIVKHLPRPPVTPMIDKNAVHPQLLGVTLVLIKRNIVA